MTNVRDFAAFKAERRKISIVTAYDAWSAHLVERSKVDAILIGDLGGDGDARPQDDGPRNCFADGAAHGRRGDGRRPTRF